MDELKAKLAKASSNDNMPETTVPAAPCLSKADGQESLNSSNSDLGEIHQIADDNSNGQAAGAVKGGNEHKQPLDDEEGWTPVPPGKTAKRGCQKTSSSAHSGAVLQCDHESNNESIDKGVGTNQNRDGNPQIPFLQ
ncbi:unnamed protein product [Amaranthus hypochondriacus]